MMIEYCKNCNSLIDCVCQKMTASDGSEICDACYKRYESKLKIRSYADMVRDHVIKNSLDGNYCILLNTSKHAHKIYKNIDDFLNKVEGDIALVDPMFGIDFEFRMFD